MGLVRLTKANTRRDILLVASHAICAVEELSKQKCTRVLTMDGLWHDVTEDISKVENAINEAESREDEGYAWCVDTTTREKTPQKPSRRASSKSRKGSSARRRQAAGKGF